MNKLMKPIPPIFSFLIIAAVCWSRLFAGEVQSPPSLEGASLEISARKEEYKNLHHDVFLNLKDGISWEGSEDRIVTYEPKGKNAHIIVVHCDKRKEDYSSGEIYEKNPSLFRRYYLSGEKSYEKAKGENPKPATITFTDKGGYCYYKGILQGYLTCAQKQEAEDLTGIPVTILLDEEKLLTRNWKYCSTRLTEENSRGARAITYVRSCPRIGKNDFIKHIRPS